MIFVHTPWSHYNTITEPHAPFLLSLMEVLSIDFPLHMIESMIDCYRDIATRDKLIFPSTITHILSHVHVTIPPSSPFYVMVAISKEFVRRSDTQLATMRPRWSLLQQMLLLPLDPFPHRFLPLFLLELRSLSLPTWISFSSSVLISVVVLTIFPMRCVK